MPQPLLVTGAGGQLGRSVVDNLLASGAGHIIATTRDPSKLADLAAKGVEVRRADFDDAASLPTAFAGAGRVLIISTDALDRPGRRLEQHLSAVAAAKAAGVKHLVYTSMPKPEPGSAVIFAPDHFGTETAIKESGLGYTILRNSWYQENLMMSLPSVLGSGLWFTSAGAGKVAHVAREDAARVAAAALASGSDESLTLDVTGPEALTTEQIAALVSDVVGKPIQVMQVTDEQLAGGMKQAGVPDFLVPLLVSFDANTRNGGLTPPTDTVERLTGLRPRPLRAFLEAVKPALVG
ncbi:SDR family oxidoreductase [Nitrospirillum sp. BR 11163]|uniref:SDR family oxidoreductase n=1 Tax=Nitrospirillum sp. BR 11163 TaxID=3104323 RepID=UPI002AFFBE51|nr:SDR family oxidoreductase [Nitrospirillum sp. BR 11163]MEA1672808.1 SDR family oxidoreductase [Nitrospirillum sp. BR 11163]